MPDMDSVPPILSRTYINASPSRVYEAIATGRGWSQWFTTKATIDAREGGSYEFFWENFGADRTTLRLHGPVLEAELDDCFVFQWGSGESITTVRFTLHPRAEGTVVEVEETGYANNPESLESCLNCAVGWGEALTLLKFYLEHGVTYGEVPDPRENLGE